MHTLDLPLTLTVVHLLIYFSLGLVIVQIQILHKSFNASVLLLFLCVHLQIFILRSLLFILFFFPLIFVYILPAVYDVT